MKTFFKDTKGELKDAIHCLACQDFTMAVALIETAQKRIDEILEEGIFYNTKEILTKKEIVNMYPSVNDSFIKAIMKSDKYCGDTGKIINRAEEDFYVQRGFDINTGEIKKIKIYSGPVLGEDPLEINLK